MRTDGSDIRNSLTRHFTPPVPGVIGVAVSGGSDSLALLYLLHEWQRDGGPDVRAATVDHGLRAEAAAEAADVARLCAGLGIAHDTLTWRGHDGTGNLPDRARRARYALLANWARGQGIADVAVGHTEDDLAETFLMRLARGAGVDGLAAMRDFWHEAGVTFHRPLLGLGREPLRKLLRARGVAWVEDPTNSDTAYERARTRATLGALAPLGIDTAMLAATARKMLGARTALYHQAHALAQDHVRIEAGDVVIARTALRDMPDEAARRILQTALRWINGAQYPPRGPAMTQFLAAARGGEAMTLQGCLLHGDGERLRIGREYNAVAKQRVPQGQIWDGRWCIDGPTVPGAEVAALGPGGLRACPDWREGGLPHGAAMASPALWRGEELLSAPLAGWPNGYDTRLVRDGAFYFDTLLSH
ncbi:tRNA(Ile)-lysidine synthase [Roseovarius sp. A-2]|uniref:tRNA lysidine(34) synthetase TilS n=1 Tax=Roseovarius sp. A-2 TaxID=1570360 RepID=UPI0009CC49CC|nr:tRNA lysidine(34) synthetase TilS [Roseovarius sp. A-2]GAW33866.1 tRNA(Ile)-lysidine synthase [Roseovarius sp. A-2]